MSRIFFGLIMITTFLAGCDQQIEEINVEQWDVYEVILNGPFSGNPYIDVELSAVFKNKEESVLVPGFYDGNGMYRIRFSPYVLGNWTYQTESNAPELSNKKGQLHCILPTGNNHGPVKIVNTYYLQYADGTPFYPVGTTAYQWTSVKQSIQAKTL
ncbi:MAG: DUF5060 domain-containing protein, partial [Cyclobacteriaceae bacterium]|nr:DUF5060 domain-containing protein [Cyclobacteriaceae bacterium]